MNDAIEVRPAPRFSTPRWLRLVTLAGLFAIFFTGSPLIALVVFPVLRLFSPTRFRAHCTRALQVGMNLIIRAGVAMGIAHFDQKPLPSSIDPAKPYVLISNHPTYVDMLFILGFFERLTCVTNGRWWKHWALGRLLRSTLYLPGPGSGLAESEHMLDTMVSTLKAGHPLLVFPEGQRSHAHQLRRFRRGAVEAAVRADVPIVPLFLAIDRPFLTKQLPFWKPPKVPPTYAFEFFDPILPVDFDHDSKRIQKHIDALYEARFEKQRQAYEALGELPVLPSGASTVLDEDAGDESSAQKS